MKKDLLVADLFCGAGGSSTGCQRALAKLGLGMDLVAVNHWDTAIATHTKNHPHARHACVSIDAARPIDLVPGGKLDLLMASPECIQHSRARGGRPINDQGRMSAWHVVRWCTELRVKCLIVENVPEFKWWGPLDRKDRPDKSRRGEYFRAWVGALESVGFRCEWSVLNAANYGDATTRERFFLLARSDGQEIRWPEATHSKDGSTGKLWKPAREIIDWSLRGKSIFRRKRPLSAKTLSRIYVGAIKFGWPEPFLDALRRYMTSLGYTVPVVRIKVGGKGSAKSFVMANRQNNVGKDPEKDPIPGFTTAAGGGIYVAEPTLVVFRNNADMRGVGDPTPTLCAGGTHLGLAQPLLVRSDMHKSNAMCVRPDSEPIATVTTSGGIGVAQAIIAPVTHHDTSDRTRSPAEPLPTITGARRGELAFIVPAFGERPTQVPRTHSVDGPAPTICAAGRVNLVQAEADSYEIDILFRMLEPRELAKAMGFDDEETTYEFVGNRTEMTKQIGNAVCVGLAGALVGALFGPGQTRRARKVAR